MPASHSLKQSASIIDHREAELVSTESLHSYVLSSLVQEGALMLSKRNVSTNPAINPLICDAVMSTRDARAMVVRSLWQ